VTRSTTTVRNPILIVGVGRSGTTLLYDILARHRDVAWFSNLTNRFPALPELAMVSGVERWQASRGLVGRWAPKPVEGYRLWRHPGSDEDGPLSVEHVTPARTARLNRIVAAHLRYQRRSRFLNKNTRNTRCIPYLNAVFDEPLFIHVLRDPRAVVASLLEVAFWPDLHIWSEGGITPVQWESMGRQPVSLAASLWAADVDKARADGSALPAGRYLEVHYEALVAEPERVLLEIMAFARLEPVPELAALLAGVKLKSRNEKFRRQLDEPQIQLVERTVGGVAARCGYVLV
jgi:hypothetical protein